jgi:hypothetical protein
MNIRSRHLVLLLLAALGLSDASAQEITFMVRNPSTAERRREPVVVPWDTLLQKAPGLPLSVEVRDALGNFEESQVDDLDCDGRPDELAFLADFRPQEERVFTVRASLGPRPRGEGMRTDAADWKRVDGVLRSLDDDNVPGSERVRGSYRFDGVGWESELTAYRLYLDERNAVDILGKRRPGLYWNFIGTSGVDYQLDLEWGMDVLHVGPALGIGGMGLWVADSLLKPINLDRQRTRIVARGPVRAVVRVEYTGWSVGKGKVDLVSTFLQYAGDRACEHHIERTSDGRLDTLAVGIVRHDSTSMTWEPARGSLRTTGLQSRAGDSLLLALNVPLSTLVREVEGPSDHLLLFTLKAHAPLRVLLWYVWQGEMSGTWSDSEIEHSRIACERRLNEPLVIRPGAP